MPTKISTAPETQFVKRPFTLFALPMPEGTLIQNPADIIVTLFEEPSIDVGSLCYLGRSTSPRRRGINLSIQPCLVDLSTFSATRADQIQLFIQFLNDLLVVEGHKPATVCTTAHRMKKFIDWCDSNQHSEALAGGEASRAAFKAFVNSRRESVENHTMKARTGINQQNEMLSTLSEFLNIHALTRGVNMMSFSRINQNRTEPPEEVNLAKTLSLCDALFSGFTDFVIEKRLFPYKLALPSYLSWEQNYLWIFPERQWCVPQHLADQVSRSRRQVKNFNFAEGRLITSEEALAMYSTGARARQELKRSIGYLAKANSKSRGYFRLQAAIRAHNGFFVLFLAQTGLNLAVARNLPWSDDIIVGLNRQGLREIKWRAGGREVCIEMRSAFLPEFRKYLELRSFLLGPYNFGLLFLKLSGDLQGPPRKSSLTLVSDAFLMLHRIDPALVKITARQLRAAKQDFHMSRSDPAVAAQLMGHTEETATKIYSAGTKSQHYSEMSRFFEKVEEAVTRKIVLDSGVISEGSRLGSLGICTEFESPSPIAGPIPVQPDCSKQEGCLFCDKYRAHADELDVRKLASCAYVIEQTINVPGARAHFKPVLERIDTILAEISSYLGSTEMVENIMRDVFVNGEITEYWAGKLLLLNELEIAP